MKDLPYKKIYFVGIKGVGMAALAVIAKQTGYSVGGSDVPDTFITDTMLERHSITVDTNFDISSIDQFIESDMRKTLIIATAAHGGLGNPQVQFAKDKGVDVLTFGQALGMFQYGTLLNRQDIVGISVAGSHGKTTTTALLATVLNYTGDDPSYVIGTSEAGALTDAGHLGKGNFFIVESDEYFSDLKYDPVPKFHYQHPFAAIITNIDYDHPDVFPNIESIYSAFEKFVKNILPDGLLIILGDNPEYQKLYSQVHDTRVITYGKKDTNDYQAVDIENTDNGVTYTVIHKQEKLGEIMLRVVGEHNAINSLSVVALLHSLGKSFEEISQGLSTFTGSKRRLELKGTTQHGTLIIDDYAHHPSEIRATYEALKSGYPDKKIVCIFQPHTLSRTEALADRFADSFKGMDQLLLLPIFTSAREGAVEPEKQQSLNDQLLHNTNGIFLENEQSVVEYCTKNFASDEFIIVTMGAGNVYKIGEILLSSR